MNRTDHLAQNRRYWVPSPDGITRPAETAIVQISQDNGITWQDFSRTDVDSALAAVVDGRFRTANGLRPARVVDWITREEITPDPAPRTAAVQLESEGGCVPAPGRGDWVTVTAFGRTFTVPPNSPWVSATAADEDADREAETLARVTGSIGATVTHETRHTDGTLTVDAVGTYSRGYIPRTGDIGDNVSNHDRAGWARAALETFCGLTGQLLDLERIGRDDGDAIRETAGDLVCDLLHLANLSGVDPQEILSSAWRAYDEETLYGARGV